MSWSVSAIGKPPAVKATLTKQFDRAKNATKGIPTEAEAVALAEQLVNNQLDFAIAQGVGAIKVDVYGSISPASKAELSSYPASCKVKVEVQSFYAFVE